MSDKKKRSLKDLLREKKIPGQTPGSSGTSFKPMIIWFAVIIAILMGLHFYLQNQKPTIHLEASELDQQITSSNIVSLVMRSDSIEVDGMIRLNPDDPVHHAWITKSNIKTNVVQFKSSIVPGDDYRNELVKRLKATGGTYKSVPANRWMPILLGTIFPLLLVFIIIGFLINRQMKRGMGMAMNFGKSRARKSMKGKDRVTFADLAGCEEAKEETREIIDYLRDPKKFERLGGRIPRGVILIGAPGTGKTLLAKAIAGEADVPFFSISGSDFVEMFVGVGAARVRDLFEQGKRNAPCIIFVDEIDAVGRQRGTGLGGGHDEREQTLNALLVEMDGFEVNDGVIIVAATNRPDVLDPALLRPGRFDRQIVIDMPDQKGRLEILQIHARKIKLDEQADLSRIARGTPGFSGADLANLVNEAALMAARYDQESVTQKYLEEARDKVRFGRERRSRVMDENDRRITAYHEAGHALVMAMIPECEPLHKVTIVPRGIAYLGATMQLPEKDKYHQSRAELQGQLASLMGGRIAEEIIFGDITSGARSDIKLSSEIARKMVCEWGMSELLGPLTYGEREEHLFLGREIDRHAEFSEQTSQKIDLEIRRIIDEAVLRARTLLTDNRDKLEAIAEALLKYEVLDGEEINKLIQDEPIQKNGPPSIVSDKDTAKSDSSQAQPEEPDSETVSEMSAVDPVGEAREEVSPPGAENIDDTGDKQPDC
jgi:cell division protease FtsH